MSWWMEKRTYRNIFIFVMLGLVTYFLYLVRGLFLPFALAIILVYLLNPLVGRMESRGSPRVGAILILYLGVIIVVTSLLMYGVPRMVNQLENLVETIPAYTDQVQDIIRNIEERFANSDMPPGVQQVINERISWVEARLLELVRTTADLLLTLVGNLFNFILAPVLAFYIMKDLEHLKRKGAAALPKEWSEDICRLAKDIDHVFACFVRGHLTVVVIVAALTSAAFALIGLEFATMLGLIAGLAELVPYFGPFIGAVPAVAIALLTSKLMAVKVIIAVFVIQQLEGAVISPRILGNSMGLHPLTIIATLLAGGHLFGIVGMLLAVPLAAIVKILVTFVWEKLS